MRYERYGILVECVFPSETRDACTVGNLCKEWKQWRQVWDAYEEVTDLRNKTSRLRVATFITCIGKEALEVHNGLPFQSEEEKADINRVLEL